MVLCGRAFTSLLRKSTSRLYWKPTTHNCLLLVVKRCACATKKAMENAINLASIELNGIIIETALKQIIGLKMMFMLLYQRLYLYRLWKVNDMPPSAPLSTWTMEASSCNYHGTPGSSNSSYVALSRNLRLIAALNWQPACWSISDR